MQLLFKLKRNGAGSYTEDGSAYMVLLTESKQAYEPTLDAVRKAVEYDYVEQQAQLKVKQLTEQALQAVMQSTPAKDVARQFGLL